MNLAYPEQAVGISSSWIDEGDPTNKRMRLTRRRAVFLDDDPRPATRWNEVAPGVTLPVRPLVKCPSGPFLGLSSGSGSAIIADHAGHFLRYKRCGLQDRSPVTGRRHPSIDFAIRRTGIHYTSDTEPLGSMWASDAIHELRCQRHLREAGFSPACGSVGYFEHGDETATAVFDIASDLRYDELLLMAVTPALSKFFERGGLKLDARHGLITLCDVSPTEVFQPGTIVFQRLVDMGHALGGVYRRFFDAGYLRGVGNAWIGNDIIDIDGRITLVDLDELVLPEELGGSSWLAAQQGWEWRAHLSTLYSYFESLSGYLLAYAAAIVASGAEAGLHERRPPIVQDVGAIVAAYLDSCDVWQDGS